MDGCGWAAAALWLNAAAEWLFRALTANPCFVHHAPNWTWALFVFHQHLHAKLNPLSEIAFFKWKWNASRFEKYTRPWKKCISRKIMIKFDTHTQYESSPYQNSPKRLKHYTTGQCLWLFTPPVQGKILEVLPQNPQYAKRRKRGVWFSGSIIRYLTSSLEMSR